MMTATANTRRPGGGGRRTPRWVMDIATGVGVIGGIATIVTLIIIDGGNFSFYWDKHAAIIIFGGSSAATMLRFPFSVIMHGLPMGLRFAFTMRANNPRELIEEITRVA